MMAQLSFLPWPRTTSLRGRKFRSKELRQPARSVPYRTMSLTSPIRIWALHPAPPATRSSRRPSRFCRPLPRLAKPPRSRVPNVLESRGTSSVKVLSIFLLVCSYFFACHLVQSEGLERNLVQRPIYLP